MLPFDLKPGTWHQVRTVVTGSTPRTVQTYVDGQLLLTFQDAFPPLPALGISLSQGSIGFGNAQGAEALFRDLSVTAAGGQTLYASTLTGPSVLDDFAAGTNAVPSILDGAKRDRYPYTGDLAQSGLTVYCSNGASDYVKGSLQLLGAYQDSNGQVPGSLPPRPDRGRQPSQERLLLFLKLLGLLRDRP
jgi:alpha-L-rhamnosidase